MRGLERALCVSVFLVLAAVRPAVAAPPSAAKTDPTQELRRRVEAAYANLHALEEERLKATRDKWEAMDVKARAVFVARHYAQAAPLSGGPADRAMEFTEQQAADSLAKMRASATVKGWRALTEENLNLLSPEEQVAFEERRVTLLKEIAAEGSQVAPLLVAELDVRGRMNTPDWWQPLRRQKERQWAAEALEQMGPAGVPHLVGFLERELPATPAWPWDLPACLAMSALARSADARAVPLLNKAIRHANPWVRQDAVQGLRRVKAPSTVPLLIAALDDNNRAVAFQACVALGEFANPKALPALRKVVADNPPQRYRKGDLGYAAQRAIEQIEAGLNR